MFWGSPLSVKKTSAEKRFAQSEVRRLRNKAIKSKCHTAVRKYVEAVQKKDEAAAAATLKVLVKELDTARGKGVLTRNSVARKKSRMTKLFNVTFAAK